MEARDKFEIMLEELEKELKELKLAIQERKLAKIGGKVRVGVDESIINEAKKSLFREM